MLRDPKIPKSVKWKLIKSRRIGYQVDIYCECACGKKRWIPRTNLRLAKSRQCHSCGGLTHGFSKTRLNSTWRGMKQRCSNPNAEGYYLYGGRGIIVCKSWRDSFVIFRNWALKNGYTDQLTIERINVNGNYTPKNCKWIPLSEQANNTRRNRVINGKNLTQWSKELGINRGALQARLKFSELGEHILRPVRKERSKYPGVTFDDSNNNKKPWRVRFGHKGKVFHGGRFKTEKQAHKAYKKLKAGL